MTEHDFSLNWYFPSCLSACLPSCPSVYLPSTPAPCLPTCQPVTLPAVHSSSLSAYLSTCPPTCRPLQLLVCLPVNLSPYLPSTPAPCLPTCQPSPLPAVPSSSLSAYLSTCPPTCRLLQLLVCLPVNRSPIPAFHYNFWYAYLPIAPLPVIRPVSCLPTSTFPPNCISLLLDCLPTVSFCPPTCLSTPSPASCLRTCVPAFLSLQFHLLLHKLLKLLGRLPFNLSAYLLLPHAFLTSCLPTCQHSCPLNKPGSCLPR